MSKKLYESNSYLTEFEAKITEIIKDKNKEYIVLDQTAFYPLGGGQEPDHGTIEDQQVVDVIERDHKILHEIPGQTLQVGQKVKGKIDWKRRYDLMQQHSGEHILSGVIENHHGLKNVGFHLGESGMRVDYDGFLDDEELFRMELEANEFVRKNLVITANYPSPQELETIGFRFKRELEGPIRIVNIPGVDVCACCGTHVARSGEVGLIKIISAEKYKGGVRLNVLCGDRAINYFEKALQELKVVSQMTSASVLEIASAVNKLKEDHLQCRKDLGALEREVVQMKLAAAEETEKDIIQFEVLSRKAMEDLAVGLRAKTREKVFLFKETEENIQYIITSDHQDVREITKKMNQDLGGKGGGQAVRTQGSLHGSRAELEEWLYQILRLR